MLPRGREGKSIAIRHFDLWESLGVHNLIFLNDVVLVEQEGGKGVHLIRAERPLFPQWHAAIDVTMRSLGKPIVNAPVACNLPWLNAIVGPLNTDFIQGFIPVLRDIGSRWLNRAQFVSAARHQRALFSIPLPVVTKSGMRHW